MGSTQKNVILNQSVKDRLDGNHYMKSKGKWFDENPGERFLTKKKKKKKK